MAKVTLKAEDVYFLSRIMKGKYLDYDYVSMMEDLGHRASMKEAKSMDRLSEAGLIFEDFAGDLEIEDKAKDLFEPIFFGEFESELIVEDHANFQRYKFHVLNGKYVQVQIKGKELEISTIEKEDILYYTPYVQELKEPKNWASDHFENMMVDGIMVVKRVKFGGKSQVIQLVNDNGTYYQAKGNRIYSLTKNELKTLMKNILWEE